MNLMSEVNNDKESYVDAMLWEEKIKVYKDCDLEHKGLLRIIVKDVFRKNWQCQCGQKGG